MKKFFIVLLCIFLSLSHSISYGVEDKKVTIDISNLPVYAIHDLLEKMEIENFAVVYDKQLASKVIYILYEGNDADVAEILKGNKAKDRVIGMQKAIRA